MIRAGIVAIIAAVILSFHCSGARAAEVSRIALPNGVRLLLSPAVSADLVAISICIRTEPDRLPIDDAAGELVARTLFSSSLNRSQEKMAAGISLVGGSIETVRTAEHVDITCVMLPAQVRVAIYLRCEVRKNAQFGALDRTRAELVAEQARGGLGIAGGLDVLRRELQARPDVSDVPYARVTREQAKTYFHARYVPAHTAIAVVGQFDKATIQTAFRDSLADFDRVGARSARNSPLYSHATNYPTRNLSQPGISGYALVATPAPALSDVDYPAFAVLKSVLGEGHASRLFQRLRDAQGIGYNVGAAWQTSLSDPLVAYLQWEVRPRAARGNNAKSESRLTPETALRLLTAQIDGLISEPPTEAEVQREIGRAHV